MKQQKIDSLMNSDSWGNITPTNNLADNLTNNIMAGTYKRTQKKLALLKMFQLIAGVSLAMLIVMGALFFRRTDTTQKMVFVYPYSGNESEVMIVTKSGENIAMNLDVRKGRWVIEVDSDIVSLSNTQFIAHNIVEIVPATVKQKTMVSMPDVVYNDSVEENSDDNELVFITTESGEVIYY
jgi:hypothetical protein